MRLPSDYLFDDQFQYQCIISHFTIPNMETELGIRQPAMTTWDKAAQYQCIISR